METNYLLKYSLIIHIIARCKGFMEAGKKCKNLTVQSKNTYSDSRVYNDSLLVSIVQTHITLGGWFHSFYSTNLHNFRKNLFLAYPIFNKHQRTRIIIHTTSCKQPRRGNKTTLYLHIAPARIREEMKSLIISTVI